MRCSLVTTVRNEAASIAELVAAIAAQTRPPDEWIVVDGGSTDGTAERLEAAGCCRVLRAPGSTIAAGRNIAIAAARHDLIAVVDAGCRPERNWLALLLAPIESGAAPAAAGPTTPVIERPFDAAQWTILDQFVRPGLRAPALSSRSLAFLKELWAACPYPEWLPYGEDRWLLEQWRARGHAIATPPGPGGAVAWRMRPTLRAVFMQHFRYNRGDAQGRLRRGVNLARSAFYAGLALLALLAFRHAAFGSAAAALWLAYLLATGAARLPEATRGRGFFFALRTALWLPLALIAMDAGKLFGYSMGTLDRTTHREP